jgi:UDP-glucose 4-epimerase
MESVLVTGGAGFIGSHTCKALAAHGFLPIAFDDLSRGHADFVRWGPLVNGNILHPAALHAAFERHRPGAVIHFTALAHVGESMSRPLLYYRVNVAVYGRSKLAGEQILTDACSAEKLRVAQFSDFDLAHVRWQGHGLRQAHDLAAVGCKHG